VSVEWTDPWAWIQEHDLARFGDLIADPVQRERVCSAVLTGGLPYLWRKKAAAVRELMYAKMELHAGDRVLIIGESIPSCGFETDIREKVGPDAEIVSIDVIERARDSVRDNIRGRSGRRGTWRYEYTLDFPDEYFDAIGIIQGVQHADEWEETGRELARVLKTGRVIMLAEIGFSPKFELIATLDMHLEYFLDKLMGGAGMKGMELSYYSPEELHAAFAPVLQDIETFEWKGAELFWGRKRSSAEA
jgi:ubiquinone/menaquinone biosynthesis C-methylase UbiE